MTIKVADAVSAYNLLNQQKQEEKTVKGVKLSALETADIFKVLYIIKALKPVVTAYEDFRKDVNKQFEPEQWTERVCKYEEASDEEKASFDKEFAEYQQKVGECVAKELDSEKEQRQRLYMETVRFGDMGRILPYGWNC